jgi:hypothetical protein
MNQLGVNCDRCEKRTNCYIVRNVNEVEEEPLLSFENNLERKGDDNTISMAELIIIHK